MKTKLRFTVNTLLWAVLLLATYAIATHAQTSATTNQPAARKGSAVQTAGASLPVKCTADAGVRAP